MRKLSDADVKDVHNVQVRVERAKDIERLRNYSRVGGVLIGREADGNDQLDFSDIRWRSGNGQVTLELQRSHGRVFHLGPYPAGLVYQALAYAVDPRPVAVTMLNAEFIDRKQVMIHPTLQDTALGARLAAADEWIFHYLEPEAPAPPSALHRSREAMYAESQLYAHALDILKGRQLSS
jgi:hypothetical protein